MFQNKKISAFLACGLMLNVGSIFASPLTSEKLFCPEQYDGYSFAAAYAWLNYSRKRVLESASCDYGLKKTGDYHAYYPMFLVKAKTGGDTLWRINPQDAWEKQCITSSPSFCPLVRA